MTFNNRIALVTGAGRGIGKAIAGQLAQGGVTVICASKNEANCGAVAAALQAAGGKARALPIDVTDGAAIAKASADLLAEFGTIDILVNNAGITRDGLLFRMCEADWNAVLATNLTSCFHWTKHLGRAMTQKRWGRIVNITSVIGLTGQRRPGQLCGGQGRPDRLHQEHRPGIRPPQRHRATRWRRASSRPT